MSDPSLGSVAILQTLTLTFTDGLKRSPDSDLFLILICILSDFLVVVVGFSYFWRSQERVGRDLNNRFTNFAW